MKILINILTPAMIAEIRETFPAFTGVLTFNGEQFIPWEWKHVPDDFVVSGTGQVYIKSARWVLAHLVRRFLREQGMHGFAQGLVEAANMYGDAVPAIATTVLAVAPEDEVPE